MNAPTNNKGFTLVEHLAVFAIIGILAAIAITSYLYVIDRARLTSGISALGALGKEMEMYNIDKGLYPLNINFNNFTDQNGVPILSPINYERIKDKVYSWDSYTPGGDTYTLAAKALNSKHTLLTLTPSGVTY